jgi:hypothetical protein
VDKDETGMVNAVLDQIARQFRASEFALAGVVILRCELLRASLDDGL